jgi:hypothetical protein
MVHDGSNEAGRAADNKASFYVPDWARVLFIPVLDVDTMSRDRITQEFELTPRRQN